MKIIGAIISYTIVLLSILCIYACVSGGTVGYNYSEDKVLVQYIAKGDNTAKVCWLLVESDGRLAIIERDQDGNSLDTIIRYGWKDLKGHHFVIWAAFLDEQSTAFEYIVPEDFTKPAKRFIYPPGSYSILESNGVKRPFPHKVNIAPATILIPQQTTDS